MSNFYIPPEGVYFRLLGYSSQRVLFSRTHLEPQVYHIPFDEVYDDQWFSLIHGHGKREGLFAIKGRRSDKVLFSRTHTKPYVWHVEGNGTYDDNWFSLEPGKGKFTSMFRLLDPASDTAVFSRTHLEPEVGNITPMTDVYDDQHFSFLFEDTEIVRVDYDLKLGKIINATPLVLASQTLTNHTQTEQEMQFTVSETETHTSTWEQSDGFTITVGTSFSAGIPFVGETEFHVDTSYSHTWTYGGSNEFSKTWSASFTAKASPGESVHAVSTVTRGQLEVPYTIVLRSKTNNVEVKTHGMWYGVSTWDLRHTVSTVEKTK